MPTAQGRAEKAVMLRRELPREEAAPREPLPGLQHEGSGLRQPTGTAKEKRAPGTAGGSSFTSPTHPTPKSEAVLPAITFTN